jgi:hypothetical protein
MNRMILKRFAIVLVVQAVFAFAQVPAQPAPTFTLTISQVGYGGTTPGNYAVRVKLKNISDHEIGDQGCLALRDWFNVSVIYNGVPMEETDAVRSLKEIRKLTKPCEGSYTGWKIEPGEEHYYRLNVSEFYDMSKPGTYEVTVTRETNPKHPDLSVTVKSNTVAIMVP